MDQPNDNGRKVPVPPVPPARASGPEAAPVQTMPTHVIEGAPRAQSTQAGEFAGTGEKLQEQSKPTNLENVQHAKDAVIEGAKDMLRDAKDAAVGSLQRVKEHAVDSISGAVASDVGDRVRRAGSSASGFISANALPLSLMGLGLGWLMLSAGRRERMARARYAYESDFVDGARGGIQQAASRAGEALGETRDNVMDRAGEVRARVMQGASEVRRRAAELGHGAYDQLGRAGSRVREFGADSPIAVGLLALALGMGAGLLLPTTRRENTLLGDTRDRLLSSARETVSELGRSVQRGAGELKEAVAEQVRA
jgi:ElaB/YqjD/DUF883 family membrane-anchored ribosome-binding protein